MAKSNFDFCTKWCVKYGLRSTGRGCCESFGTAFRPASCYFFKPECGCEIYDIRPLDCKQFPFDFCMEENGEIWLLCYFRQICLGPLKNEFAKKILEWWFIRKNKLAALELIGGTEELTPDIVKEWSDPALNKMRAKTPKRVCRLQFVDGRICEKTK